MSHIISYTFLMMGGAFIIGFGVAYLIKIISFLLNYSENISSDEYKNTRKKIRERMQIRRNNLKKLLLLTQASSQDKLLNHFYPSQTEENNDFDFSDNELMYYYYGKY